MKQVLYVGTYTGGENSDSPATSSKGVYAYEIAENGPRLLPIGAYSHGDIDPGFFAIRQEILFIENERKDFGTIRSFAIQKNGELNFVDRVKAPGSKCAHICVDRHGPYVFGAVYASGNVMVAKSTADGNMVLTDTVQHFGKSVVPVRQDAPRAHSCCQTPDGNGLLVADLGIDKIMNYTLDRVSGRLLENKNQPSVSVQPGDGPRHMVFHPSGQYLYLLTEIGNKVYVYDFDQPSRTLREIQQKSVLPEDFDGASHAAEIIVSNDGSFIYVSNRGHDTVTAFSIDRTTGKLSVIGYYSSGGFGPRHICFGPKEETIIVANKDSNEVCVLARDRKSGVLGGVVERQMVPAPACVGWTTVEVK